MLVALGLELAHQIEIVARRARALRTLERALGQRHHRESRRQHQRLLTAGDQRVDAPLVHLLLEHADRGNPVDDQHRVARARDRGDFGHRMNRAGRGLARLHQHRARIGIGAERVFDLLRTRRAAPFDADLMAGHPIGREQLAPALAKLAAVDVDRMLARREQVGHRRLHRAGAAGREQDHLLARAEQRAHPLARLVEHGAELGRAMMDHRTRHLEQDLGRNRRGSGREQIFFYRVFHQYSRLRWAAAKKKPGARS